jgi:hypothetical protein
MIDLKADVDKAGLDLASSVDQQDFDPAPVRAAYAVFQTARHKLENERFEMLLEVRQVLTYEQWRKIEEIKRAEEKRSRGAEERKGDQWSPFLLFPSAPLHGWGGWRIDTKRPVCYKYGPFVLGRGVE